jgi:hypothetical protein
VLALQNNSVDVDVDIAMEEITLLPDYSEFSWIEPVAGQHIFESR